MKISTPASSRLHCKKCRKCGNGYWTTIAPLHRPTIRADHEAVLPNRKNHRDDAWPLAGECRISQTMAHDPVCCRLVCAQRIDHDANLHRGRRQHFTPDPCGHEFHKVCTDYLRGLRHSQNGLCKISAGYL